MVVSTLMWCDTIFPMHGAIVLKYLTIVKYRHIVITYFLITSMLVQFEFHCTSWYQMLSVYGHYIFVKTEWRLEARQHNIGKMSHTRTTCRLWHEKRKKNGASHFFPNEYSCEGFLLETFECFLFLSRNKSKCWWAEKRESGNFRQIAPAPPI